MKAHHYLTISKNPLSTYRPSSFLTKVRLRSSVALTNLTVSMPDGLEVGFHEIIGVRDETFLSPS